MGYIEREAAIDMARGIKECCNGVDNCPNCPFVNGWGSCRLEDGAPFEWELESEEECE